MIRNRKFLLPSLFLLAAGIMAFTYQKKPTLWLIGDSTMNNNTSPMRGWGNVADQVFDTTKITINNSAMAGRSTRTFVKEGRWTRVINAAQPGDYLIMAFGHNEGSRPDTSRSGYRGVFRGIGADSVVLNWKDGTQETVHSYGWYLEKFAREAQAKGVKVIIASMIPRNEFRKNAEGKDTVMRANRDYGLWSKQVAEKTGAYFVDLNKITSDKYDKFGPVDTKKLFPGDHTHTNTDGAIINAQSVAEGIKMQPSIGLNAYLRAFEPHKVPVN
jgi:lysophospholipase L1-like esterase